TRNHVHAAISAYHRRRSDLRPLVLALDDVGEARLGVSAQRGRNRRCPRVRVDDDRASRLVSRDRRHIRGHDRGDPSVFSSHSQHEAARASTRDVEIRQLIAVVARIEVRGSILIRGSTIPIGISWTRPDRREYSCSGRPLQLVFVAYPWMTDLVNERRSKTEDDAEDKRGGEKSERRRIDGSVLPGSNHRAIVLRGFLLRVREPLGRLLHE